MAKARTHYVCNACGGVQSRWMGKCPDCGEWDSLEKFIEPKEAAGGAHADLAGAWANEGRPASQSGAAAERLSEIEPLDVPRLETCIGEFDRVLGGGLVPGSVVLLGGDPGIGKSTLLLQAAVRMAGGGGAGGAGRTVLYVSSEESAQQVKLRAERLVEACGNGGEARREAPRRVDNKAEAETRTHMHDAERRVTGAHGSESGAARDLFILAETNLGRIVEQARRVRPAVCVIDSIQMVYKSDLDASPGSMAQLRRCCLELTYLAKVSGMAIVLVGHVTKEGRLAGPRLLEHLVDVVLSFEGDRHHAHRVVRGIKNRFGATFEVGLFEMTGGGLMEVPEGSLTLDPTAPPRPGSVVCPVMHGSRCLLAEAQALTATGILGAAKRRASGLDANRLAMLIAVLEKHGGLRLMDQDIFTSAAGGMKVVEPAVDLAVALAIAGAHYSRRLPAGMAVVGEVGLGGEVRTVKQIDQRRREAVRLGYQRILLPHEQADEGEGEAIGVKDLNEAVGWLQ